MVCSEGLARWPWFEPFLSYDVEDGISDVREGEWSVSGTYAAVIFPEGHILDVEETVLDGPMPARHLKQGVCVGAFFRQACDGVDDLFAAAVLEFTSAFDPTHAHRIRPLLVEAGRDRPHGNDARLDTAVSLVDMVRARHVGWITAPVGLSRRCRHSGGGNRRRRRVRSRPAARAGWLLQTRSNPPLCGGFPRQPCHR